MRRESILEGHTQSDSRFIAVMQARGARFHKGASGKIYDPEEEVWTGSVQTIHGMTRKLSPNEKTHHRHGGYSHTRDGVPVTISKKK